MTVSLCRPKWARRKSAAPSPSSRAYLLSMIFSENRFALCANAALRVGIMLRRSGALGDDDLQIFAGNDQRAVLGDVELLDQRQDVGLQLLLRDHVDGAERLVRRAVIGAEDIEEVRRRLVAEGEMPALRGDDDVAAKNLLKIILLAPHDRRLHAGRRRHGLADGLQEVADEAFRRPVGETDLAAGTADANQLA